MTQSQLDHLKVQSNKLVLKCGMINQDSMKAYLLDTLKPFKFAMESKKLNIHIEDLTLPAADLKSRLTDPIKSILCTDFKLYEEILFHLF
jgi:hypothetical protein